MREQAIFGKQGGKYFIIQGKKYFGRQVGKYFGVLKRAFANLGTLFLGSHGQNSAPIVPHFQNPISAQEHAPDHYRGTFDTSGD